ncbi:methyl-accepting chemotaxis protein [Desulfobacula phenolica]|uniref:Cache domain-containing protein n=1 Tax=Desulfobacula phenolica TaxID=90732 RepID=A0A1H2DRM4_9BACT|nr:Cache 3/Cache 2 fusion domain-containing protein [Desulfobacula phenolica]SDT85008.1 Cache domain-containing protein [Desulfobacula phenolica]
MKALNLNSKFILFALLISVIPLGFSLFLSIMNNQKMSSLSVEESMKLGDADMTHIVENVNSMCLAQNGLAQEVISNALKTSRNILESTGKVTLSMDEKVTWNAVNQFTKTSTSIDLPKMLVGGQWLKKNQDMNSPSIIVDKTRDLSVETCTIFQRMNEKGDMLRVCTNVQKLDGKRAIGTFIPAVNPNGSPNAVVSTVLKGNTFKGRAFVVNAWYMTAYEPIYDDSNNVVGILYVGIKQKTLEKSLVDEIVKIKVGQTGHVYVLNSKGEYIVSKNNEQNGQNILDTKDGAGNFFIQDIIEKAHGLDAGNTGSHKYFLNRNEKLPQTKIVKIKYFKDWDWIIGVEAYEEDFLVVKDKIIKLGRHSNYLFVIASAIILAAVMLASFFFARRITKPIMLTTEGLYRGTDQTYLSSTQVSDSSQSLAEGSSRQAASIEETSASMEEISSMTKQNSANASQADNLMMDANKVINTATESMEQVIASMDDISKASEETSKIIKTIDEIAFQTNLLALNAAVEAARAGEAGAGFAVVADEVRNLAMRAADAAKNTAEMIEGTVKKINAGSMLVSATNKAFSKVAESSTKVGQLVSEISKASKEQSNGIEQVTSAFEDMDRVIQQNAVDTEESASAAEIMTTQTEQLREHVGDLVLLVSGKKDQGTALDNYRAIKTISSRPGSSKRKKILPRRPEKIRAVNYLPVDTDEDF